ncbi:FimV/HubP family polar landmark protein [Tepidicella baoligensis]|uniref:FimV/HubP family polar landmark protein n=1 Tax=Tepidicella baoligensis TaxID=2707016 RepID=UPI0015DA9BEC|nr:FimV/HubP family polar landmark protein [Tepidicella baoligensis]
MVEVSVQQTTSNRLRSGPSAPGPQPQVSATRHGWRAVAAAVVLASAVVADQAWALALGRIQVQSLLGEPLRAEIDVPSITAEERSSLQIGIATPERFRAANMDFNALLQDVKLELVQRPDGRTMIRLSSERVVTDPFLDVVVQATWNNGQLLRGYTLLFDPPNLRPAPSPLLPAAPAAPVITEVRPATPVPPPATPSAAPAPVTAPRPPAPAPAAPAATEVAVQWGDTAGRIAQAHLPAGVSLDQMLIAMLRANPHAFMGNNVNRLMAGVVLNLPDAQEAAAINPAEARQLVVAQSRDFNEYRRRLAGMAPAQATPAPTRSAAGTVQAEVTDQQPSATAQDRLTLAKGTEPDPQTEQIAQARQQEADQARTRELDRNLQELQRLQEAAQTVTVPPADAPPPATAPAAEPPLPGPAIEAPVPPPPPTAPAAAPAPAVGSWMQSLTAHPYALPAGGGLVALLALLGLLRWRRQRQETALAEQDEPAPSEYRAAEGQTVDTSEEAPVSSMMYSPSQLDAGGDVDPVAEADVYLAYGRDRQAEEILQEAIRLHPERLPARLKLLEIYAQRNDVNAFNAAAAEVHDLTGGTGPQWQQAREAGLKVDPDNPLYLKGAAPAERPDDAPLSEPPDIDLNFDAPESPATPEGTPSTDRPESGADDGLEAPRQADNAKKTDLASETSSAFDLDFSELEAPEASPAPPPADQATDLPAEVKDLSLDLDLDLDTPTAPPPAATDGGLPPREEDPMAGFELDETLGDNDPLETKLSLAREFQAIGDTEGARSLAEEVEAEASGELRERARAFLSELS